MFTKFCAGLSKLCLWLAVILLIAVVLCVQWQVIGRYIFNDSPTWAEALAMLLIL
ncbi:MAG: 2,3-diketo-L-gulonate transporter small permease protein YiaM, partial [Pseudomonadota bacterium]